MAEEHVLGAHAAASATEAAFNDWLHRSLNRLDAIVLGVFLLYWTHQTWLSGGHPSEAIVLLIIGCLLVFRVFTWRTRHAAHRQPETPRIRGRFSPLWPLLMSNTAESDGVRWCVCLLVAHAVEAGTIAIGRQERVLNIAQPRLDHRELGHVVCLLIGLMHGIRPIPRRLKLWTAIVFELIFLAWLAPCMPALTHPVVERTRVDGPSRAHGARLQDAELPLHPSRLPSGAVNADWIKLVGGCAVFFALGYVASWLMLLHVVRPLWQMHVGQIERLTAEKQRLLYDYHMAESRRELGSDGGMRCRLSAPSSTAGTNTELRDLSLHAELLQHEGVAFLDSPPDATPVPLFCCLAEYEGERHRSGFCYLTTPAMREPFCARVAPSGHGEQDGGGPRVLVDADGVPLNPSGESATEVALYVVTADGELIISFNIRPQASRPAYGAAETDAAANVFHHHSSLVGGGAVAAAGMMRIRKGAVVALNNASGHYRPTGATLEVVMGRLEALGLDGLDQIEVIDITAGLGGVQSRPPSGGMPEGGADGPIEITSKFGADRKPGDGPQSSLVRRPTVQRPLGGRDTGFSW